MYFQTASKKLPVISKTEKDVVEEQNKKNSQKDVDELKRRIEDELDDEETQRAKTKKEKEKVRTNFLLWSQCKYFSGIGSNL